VAEQTSALLQLHESGTHLMRMQEGLQTNLQALANVGSFEQAVHSLTAAIHLLTARVENRPAMANSPANAMGIRREGKAA
jgi:hypothetical protein